MKNIDTLRRQWLLVHFTYGLQGSYPFLFGEILAVTLQKLKSSIGVKRADMLLAQKQQPGVSSMFTRDKWPFYHRKRNATQGKSSP